MPQALAGCAGKSSSESGGESGQGGSSGTASTSHSGGSKAGGGVPGTGGTSGATGGASGGSPGCEFERKHFDEGASWPVDCNTCYCEDSRVVCTEKVCSSGTGGAASGGEGGRGGVASAGDASAGGTSSSCTYAPIGSFCVVGSPSGDGQELVAGMPLTVSMRPEGCYSSSCTRVVSSDCNYIGSGGVYWVTGFVCLATEGNACTDDCGGGGNPVCQPGVTLTAGDYTVGIGGTSLAVEFSVPSHVAGDELCASLGEL